MFFDISLVVYYGDLIITPITVTLLNIGSARKYFDNFHQLYYSFFLPTSASTYGLSNLACLVLDCWCNWLLDCSV